MLFSDDKNIKDLIEIHDVMMMEYNDNIGEKNRFFITETIESFESQESDNNEEKLVKSIEDIGDLMKSKSTLKLKISPSLIDNDVNKIKLLNKVLDLSLIKGVVKI